MVRRLGLMRFAALGCVVTLAACGGGGFDAHRLVAQCGLDCAVEEARFRLAAAPRDRDLYVALGELEERRGRPGAALEALDAAERLGRPFRGGLGADDRARLGRLLIARARLRVAAQSPGADSDVARVRGLGVEVPADLARAAALVAIGADLRHADPKRRARGRSRLAILDPVRAAALDGRATPAVLGATAAWLEAAGARRVLHDMLEATVHAGGVAALAAAPGTAEQWLAMRRWWGGPAARPPLLTVEAAEAAGAGPCWFPRPGSGCDVIAAGGSRDPAGPRWEPMLVTVWERDGVRAADRDQALAWMIVARRAVARGQLASWERAVRDHVDVPLLADPRVADAIAHAVADLGPGVDRPLDGEAWPIVAAALATPPSADGAALRAVATAYGTDPALADRRAADALAVAVDVAAAAPPLARLFALLGDPARARALWQRAVDASPEDPRLALGLALALADAGDPAAGQLQMIRAAAASGDAAATFLAGARGFAAAGHTVDALALAGRALLQGAPGDEAAAAAVAAALLDQLGRAANAAALRALAPTPAAWDGSDGRAAVEAAAAVAAATAGTPARQAALARLAYLAGADDPGLARLAAAVLRARLAPRPDPGVR